MKRTGPRNPPAIGERFGSWTVVGAPVLKQHAASASWQAPVRCRCGTESNVRIAVLRAGSTKGCRSCGQIERARLGESPVPRKHGNAAAGRRSPTYLSWLAMNGRCQCPGTNGYHRYGGRGIRVCDRWRLFENFLADMGERPDGASLDRVDPDGHYEPSNCRWATTREQNFNKCNSRRLAFEGREQHIIEWAEEKGMKLSTLAARLRKGWSVERALTEPVAPRKSRADRPAEHGRAA